MKPAPVIAQWDGHLAVHRQADLPLIRAVLRELAPDRVIELGTAEGGFAAFLACTVIEWDGEVLTLDANPLSWRAAAWFDSAYPNLTRVQTNILHPTDEALEAFKVALREPYTCLYTDNGAKKRELELYVPLLHEYALVGTHDYGTEVDPVWAEDFMREQGFRPYRHADFEALASPPDYPLSLTRFWIRGDE